MSWQIDLTVQIASFELSVHFETQVNVIAIIGANGSGKSTLLKAIAGAFPTISGSVRIDAKCLFDSAHAVNLPIESRGISYVPPGHHLLPHLTIDENAKFGRLPSGQCDSMFNTQVTHWLTQLGCADYLNAYPNTLSTGQRQRAVIARALARQPGIFLFDEPLANIDPIAKRDIRHALSGTGGIRSTPTLIVTHDHCDVLELADLVCVLDKGKMVQLATPNEIIRSPVNEFTEAFFDAVSPRKNESI